MRVPSKGSGDTLPVGCIIAWSTNATIPKEYLECNRQAVSNTLYPKLAILMGNVPNYQGVFLRGYGSQTQVDKIYGNVIHSSAALNILQGDTIRNIWETIVGSGSVEEYATYTGAFIELDLGLEPELVGRMILLDLMQAMLFQQL